MTNIAPLRRSEQSDTREVVDVDREPSAVPVVKWHKDDDGRNVMVVEEPSWSTALGTKSIDLSQFIAEQLVLLSASNNQVSGKELAFNSAALAEIKPGDPMETMLATQMLAIHKETMAMSRRLGTAETVEVRKTYVRGLSQLARTFAAQTEALKKYRTKGTQKIIVKHVTVNEGGQAIVGDVNTGKGSTLR